MSNKDTHAASDTLALSAAQIEINIAHYPEEIKPDILWLAGYIRTECQCSLKVFMLRSQGAGVTRAQNTWYQIVTGRYFRTGGNAAAVSKEIAEIREYHNRGTVKGRMPFVETSTWHMVEDYIDALRAPDNICRMGIIAADTGTQKTACNIEYARRNNHGTTVRFEAPATPSLMKLIQKWLKCYTRKNYWRSCVHAENELRDQLNERKCVIIENAQRLYLPRRGADQPLFSFLQEIQEDTGCTLILVWTKGFTQTFLGGEDRAFFEQFVGRVGGVDQILTLPEKPPVKDLRKIAKTLHVQDDPKALDYLKQWASAEGKCRILFSKLQKAKRYAEAEDSETIDLRHLAAADAHNLNQLEIA